MIRYPTLTPQVASRDMVDVFKGYNHNLRISDGEFFDMKNMTSDFYPVLSPRKARGAYATLENPTGLIAKDSLCYTDGKYFVMNECRIDMGLNDEPKQLISMGAYVIILPDEKYINTNDIPYYGTDKDTQDRGNIGAGFESSQAVTFELCSIAGEIYDATPSPSEPGSPENMDYWIDQSSVPHTLKQYSRASGMWVPVATTYVKISTTGIGAPFNQYDGVTISGIKDASLQDLNASMVVWEKGDDYIVVVGILDSIIVQEPTDGTITVKREMPKMDFITESGNRLWGCCYGVANNGQVVNEIYASKLGDFKNWNCFMGLSTDSYAASCGTDGPFTGAITHMGYPIFFKENCFHKVYGNFPSNFQIQDTACRGVQRGCDKSLAIVNETLFYKARSGICAFDGSLPGEVSYQLGNEVYGDAVGGAHGNKYYVSMKDTAEQWHLFVYDMAKGMWHREDNLEAKAFCSCRGEMYCINGNQILGMTGIGEKEESVSWMVETGELALSSPDMKYVSRLTLRMSMEAGATLKIYIQYDLDNEWKEVGSLVSTSLRSFSVPVRPRRCDHLKLRLEGTGGARIYSITKTIEQGSELS